VYALRCIQRTETHIQKHRGEGREQRLGRGGAGGEERRGRVGSQLLECNLATQVVLPNTEAIRNQTKIIQDFLNSTITIKITP